MEQWKAGEYVVSENSGVCKVLEVGPLDLNSSLVEKKREYYTMEPVSNRSGRIYVPVGSTKSRIRKVMNREAALKLIDSMKDIDLVWVDNERTREQEYKNTIKDFSGEGWIRIMKTMYQRKQIRGTQGKRLTSIDEKYWKIAEKHLFEELSIALQIPYEKVGEFIESRIKEPVK
ncbi:CarD family transcriptional regulator [Lachnoclostridium edouardi]|uniref:CarD family transcriptional regulator n=1 Tax=Lachnoclostridium edouardi TaxID=1926283 RepID=UPI000C7AF808|nr:CarD family transcriptional regulator [Lachnoclostridium edouardi]